MAEAKAYREKVWRFFDTERARSLSFTRPHARHVQQHFCRLTDLAGAAQPCLSGKNSKCWLGACSLSVALDCSTCNFGELRHGSVRLKAAALSCHVLSISLIHMGQSGGGSVP